MIDILSSYCFVVDTINDALELHECRHPGPSLRKEFRSQ